MPTCFSQRPVQSARQVATPYISGDSLNVNKVQTLRGELFYWMAILFSNTLGTALGDFLADAPGWVLPVAPC